MSYSPPSHRLGGCLKGPGRKFYRWRPGAEQGSTSAIGLQRPASRGAILVPGTGRGGGGGGGGGGKAGMFQLWPLDLCQAKQLPNFQNCQLSELQLYECLNQSFVDCMIFATNSTVLVALYCSLTAAMNAQGESRLDDSQPTKHPHNKCCQEC